MKCNKNLLIVLMVFISLLAVGSVSASDSSNMTDTMGLSVVDDELQAVEIDDNQMNDLLSVNEDHTKDIEIDINVNNTTYDEQVSVEGTVVDNTGTIDFDNSTVEICVDDELITNAPISSSGKYEYVLDLGAFEVGTHYAKATLISGGNRIVTAGTVFSIAKANPIVTVENVTAIIGAGVKVPVNVTDRKGRNLSGDAIVTIFIDGNSISKYAKIINGSAEATFDMADMMGSMMSGDMDWGSMFGGNSSQNSTMQFNISSIKNRINNTGNGTGYGPIAGNGNGPFGGGSSAVKFNYFFQVRS